MQDAVQRLFMPLVILAVILAAGVTVHADEKKGDEDVMEFVYVLRLVPRLHDEGAWTEADNEAVEDHVQHLQAAMKAGTLVLAGRTTEPRDKTFGLVVFEAPDEAAARKFMESDPAVAAGVMTATLHPYSVFLIRE